MATESWRIDEDGSLRTQNGMKVARLTPDGYIEVFDRVEHRTVRIALDRLIELWLQWRETHRA